VNADASRNPVDFEEANCNAIKPNKLLNPNDPKDAEIISKMLEESDEEPETKIFKLYLSDNEEFEDLLLNDNLPDFERKEIPNLGSLALGKAKAIKYKKHYHMALPFCKGQREGPTMTLTQITAVIKDLRIVEKLKLETISIAKIDYINNVPWNNIKSTLYLIFIDSSVKIIICNGLVKYPPQDLPIIIREMYCLPTAGHRGVTKTFNRIKHNYYWENLKSDVQRYIQQCLQCQLKKLVRVKTKQSMIIIDQDLLSIR